MKRKSCWELSWIKKNYNYHIVLTTCLHGHPSFWISRRTFLMVSSDFFRNRVCSDFFLVHATFSLSATLLLINFSHIFFFMYLLPSLSSLLMYDIQFLASGLHCFYDDCNIFYILVLIFYFIQHQKNWWKKFYRKTYYLGSLYYLVSVIPMMFLMSSRRFLRQKLQYRLLWCFYIFIVFFFTPL